MESSTVFDRCIEKPYRTWLTENNGTNLVRITENPGTFALKSKENLAFLPTATSCEKNFHFPQHFLVQKHKKDKGNKANRQENQ